MMQRGPTPTPGTRTFHPLVCRHWADREGGRVW